MTDDDKKLVINNLIQELIEKETVEKERIILELQQVYEVLWQTVGLLSEGQTLKRDDWVLILKAFITLKGIVDEGNSFQGE